MKSWPVQDAKARFSEMLETCVKDGPQLVTKHGVDTAVLVPFEEWQRLRSSARPSAKDILLAPWPKADLDIPKRGRFKRRPIPDFD